MKRIACLIAALALALTGCDTFNQMIGIVGADYRPPLKTGAIKGKIVDRNGQPLVGAKVSNGAAVYFTADEGGTVKDDKYDANAAQAERDKHTLKLGKGEFVLTKVAANTINYITAEFDGQTSPAIQLYVNAAEFDASKEAGKQGLNLVPNDIKIAIDEPVAAESEAVTFISTDIADNLVSVATTSTSLQYDHSKVSIFLKAPPGGKGVTVRSSRVNYLSSTESPLGSGQTGLTTNNNAQTLPAAVTVLPGTNTTSGPRAQVDVPFSLVTNSLINYVSTNREFKVQITLYSDLSASTAVKDRSTDADLKVNLTVKLVQ